MTRLYWTAQSLLLSHILLSLSLPPPFQIQFNLLANKGPTWDNKIIVLSLWCKLTHLSTSCESPHSAWEDWTAFKTPPLVSDPSPHPHDSPVHLLWEPTQGLGGLYSIQDPAPGQWPLPARLYSALSDQLCDVDPGGHRNCGGGRHAVQLGLVMVTTVTIKSIRRLRELSTYSCY